MIAMLYIGEYGNFLGYCSAASLADVHRGPIWLSESSERLGRPKPCASLMTRMRFVEKRAMPTLTVVFAGEGMHGCKGSTHYVVSMPLPRTHVLLLSSC